jgi:hypothetical protein
MFNMRRSAATIICLLTVMVACRRETTREKGEAPPPVVSAQAGICKGGGGKVSDPVAAKLLVSQVGGYCLDPNNEVRTYGKDAKGTIEQVCTELFDGECEVYRSFGLERVVSARYADGEGSPGTVTINLSRFDSAQGALGFFTKRVVGDADPANLTTEVMDAGTMAVLGSGNAYVWRGAHVVELAYANDNEAPEAIKSSGKKILPLIGKAIGELLPGDKQLPRVARLLPEKERLPMGLLYEPKDALGLDGVGPGAIGFYRAGDKRYRILVLDRANEEAAQDVMKTLKRVTGASETKGNLPTLTLSFATSTAGRKTQWTFGRAGQTVVGIGDEERVGDGNAKNGFELSLGEKQTLLASVVTALPKPENQEVEK